MQHWTRRGFQTVLVSGGLLMLGTGIASAQENVNPDLPVTSPLNLSVHIPIKAQDNQIATPLGKLKLPDVDRSIDIPSANDTLRTLAPKSEAKSTAKVAGSTGADKSVPIDMGKQNPLGKLGGISKDLFHGNKADVNIAAPIELCGNSIGVGAKSTVSGSCDQTVSESRDIETDGTGQSLGGNAAAVDWALPVQITGNAVGGLGGDAKSDYTATQTAETTGNIITAGSNAAGSGNAVAVSPATPIELNGAAVSGLLGTAQSNSTSANSANSGGYLATEGNDSVIGGNGVGVAPALPVELNDIAAAGLGGDSKANNGAHVTDATAGAGNPDASDIPMYISTAGKNSVLGGNTVAGDIATPVKAAGIGAAGLVGAAKSEVSTNDTTAHSGGATVSDGTDSVLGGNSGHAPIALPVQLCGIAGSGLGAIAGADCATTVEAKAGGSVAPVQDRRGNTYTNGNDSVVGGNIASLPLANSADLCGITGAGLVAKGDSNCVNDVISKTGGYDGSLGNGATVGGNIVSAPLSIPAEIFGFGAAAGADANAAASENKEIQAGGEGNSNDDNGVIASNIVNGALALPVQVFGDGAALGGKASGKGTTTTTDTAGGINLARGANGSGSANIVSAPLAGPLQIFGIGGVLGGQANGEGNGNTTTAAGGDIATTAENGVLGGNVVTPQAGLVGQLFGDSAALVGQAGGKGDNVVSTTAGGNTTDKGDGGSLTGNVVTAPLNPLLQGFGSGAHVLGIGAPGATDATNQTTGKVGGIVDTTGENGSLAGNVVDAPVQALGGIFGNAITAGGNSTDGGVNAVDATNGGPVTTNGDSGSLAGNIVGAQANPIARLLGQGVGAIGMANATGVDGSSSSNGGDLTTSGVDGHGAGNILDVPAIASPQLYGNAVGVIGKAIGSGVNGLTATNGGTDTTSDQDTGALSGIAGKLPVAVPPEIYNFGLPILAKVLPTGVAGGSITNGGEPVTALPIAGDQLPGAGELPTLPVTLPSMGQAGLPVLPAANGTLPALPSLPSAAQLPTLPGLGGNKVMPIIKHDASLAPKSGSLDLNSVLGPVSGVTKSLGINLQTNGIAVGEPNPQK